MKFTWQTLSLLTLLFYIYGCSSDKSLDQEVVDYSTIASGFLTGNGAEDIEIGGQVIRTASEFSDLIQKMNSYRDQSIEFDVAEFDFQTYMIIGIFADVKPTQAELSVTTISETDSEIFIDVSLTEMDNTIVTQPYLILQIPVSSKTLQSSL